MFQNVPRIFLLLGMWKGLAYLRVFFDVLKSVGFTLVGGLYEKSE